MLPANLELPKRGTFKVNGGFAFKLLLGAGLLSTMAMAFAAGMLRLGNDTRRQVRAIDAVWTHGAADGYPLRML